LLCLYPVFIKLVTTEKLRGKKSNGTESKFASPGSLIFVFRYLLPATNRLPHPQKASLDTEPFGAYIFTGTAEDKKTQENE
jgi:hypothetical protein